MDLLWYSETCCNWHFFASAILLLSHGKISCFIPWHYSRPRASYRSCFFSRFPGLPCQYGLNSRISQFHNRRKPGNSYGLYPRHKEGSLFSNGMMRPSKQRRERYGWKRKKKRRSLILVTCEAFMVWCAKFRAEMEESEKKRGGKKEEEDKAREAMQHRLLRPQRRSRRD